MPFHAYYLPKSPAVQKCKRWGKRNGLMVRLKSFLRQPINPFPAGDFELAHCWLIFCHFLDPIGSCQVAIGGSTEELWPSHLFYPYRSGRGAIIHHLRPLGRTPQSADAPTLAQASLALVNARSVANKKFILRRSFFRFSQLDLICITESLKSWWVYFLWWTFAAACSFSSKINRSWRRHSDFLVGQICFQVDLLGRALFQFWISVVWTGFCPVSAVCHHLQSS